MLASAIRELAASKDPTWIAAAFFERTVQIWDVRSFGKVSEFPTVFCSGAGNLAFAPSTQALVAGLSTAHGKVAAYDVRSGGVVWERRIVYPSMLRFHPSGKTILCSSADRSAIRLDVPTGSTVEVIKGSGQYIEGPYGEVLNVPARNGNEPFHLIGKGHSFEIERLSFALLDAQFSPDSLCIAEAVGPVRCINSSDGKERWRFDSGPDSQVVSLHYSAGMNCFFGILRRLTKGGSGHLVRFAARSGVCERVCDLDSWEGVFLESADQLVTSVGEIRDISNGGLVGRLDFPLSKYPDGV